MERSAHATLSLRALSRLCFSGDRIEGKAFQRLLETMGANPTAPLGQEVENFGLSSIWRKVQQEALNATLGRPDHDERVHRQLKRLTRRRNGGLVLIGGPPCQAYSIAGRARNKGVADYRPEDDQRNYLYREYLAILKRLQPDVFVMENVKGILSSNVAGTAMFERILEDLRNPTGRGRDTYELIPLACFSPDNEAGTRPSDFLIRSELFGVPQARHRVIVLGVRKDLMRKISPQSLRLTPAAEPVALGAVLNDLPRLRSGISKGSDTPKHWQMLMEEHRDRLRQVFASDAPELASRIRRQRFSRNLPRQSGRYRSEGLAASHLQRHFRGRGLDKVFNHETRSHMDADLARYLFCATFRAHYGRSPKTIEFPKLLWPKHSNWASGDFADRFWVQPRTSPASTVTSHVSKDGHHYIHWDPTQCRSLTVREVARAQTFPDDYVFLGNRTQQYVQVGNAVPPLLARQIAGVVLTILA
jgi:DNA (cytosine-5)-methyltransferase 1